jgi:outer membrane protein TolC
MTTGRVGTGFLWHWCVPALAALGLLNGVTAWAQEVPAQTGPSITLTEAVAAALAQDPELALSRSSVQIARGRLEEARGMFDSRFNAMLSSDRVEQTLLSTTLEFEEGKRKLFRDLNKNLTQVADDLEQQLADPGRLPILRCPDNIILVGSLNICLSNLEAARREAEDDQLRLLIELAGNPEERARLEEARRQQLEAVRPIAQKVLEELRKQAAIQAQNLRNLGPMPEREERYSLDLDLRFGKLFRTGLRPSCGVILQSVKDKYVDKPLLAAFGGKGLPVMFSVFEGCQLETPLMRGLGRLSTGAGEAASRARYQSSLSQLGQAHSERALNVIAAYWQAAAARDRRTLLEHTVALEEKLEADARALVEGEELAASEISRAVGRLAVARQELAAARQAEFAARLELATAMGLALQTPDDAPAAADPLPDPSLPADVGMRHEDLVESALVARSDLAAARLLEDSAAVLAAAARKDLEPFLDLVLQAGYFARHPSFKQDFYDLNGFRDAFGESQSGPSFKISLKFSFPVGNREAGGRLVEAEALRLQAGIRRREIARRVSNGIFETLGSLERARAESAARDLSAARYEQTFANTRELLGAGEATLVDTLLTEEQWTAARLDAIEARLAFALLAARFRFESGTLVTSHERDGQIVIDPVVPYGPGL